MNLENTCYIVGAASLDGVRLSPRAGDYVIAADGGYRSLKDRGIEPDFVMGDFDSLGYRPDHPNVETHPVMKDDTDLGLAVRWALAHGYRRLVMAGTVSVFSSGDAARGVTLRGLLYEITDAELRCAMPLGVSNSFTGAAATVRVTDGTVYVLWQGDALPDGLEVRHGAD